MPFNEMGIAPDLIMVRVDKQSNVLKNVMLFNSSVITSILSFFFGAQSPWLSIAYDFWNTNRTPRW